ncbi:flagellar biosynthesis repressor FlbT [Litorisediminicola beolgyonensis]|uniref:Flagellar biosynthesis repressor FlbT n=1 Tax=Litorisediminicola beolgyonensis TaxID=1173614 RepID=A0ABW3ZG99_9RHOB
MTGLVLKLAPKERLLINGAILENGEKRGRLSVLTPDVHILRLRDAIHPDDAKTPVRRACYALQLVLIGETDCDETRISLLPRVEELSRILTDADSRRLLGQASEAILARQFYKALKALRALIPREDRLLATKATK